MHGNTRPPSSLFGLDWKPAHVALTVLTALIFLIFLLLLLTLATQLAQAQNAGPATARQAATMPQFASRLRGTGTASRPPRPYDPQASRKNPGDQRGSRGWLPTDDVIYTNGPINGTTDAWAINFGFITSNTFAVANSDTSISGLSFGAWLFPGDILQSVEVSITDSEFGGTTYFDGVVSFSQSNCIGNQYGFNICTETGSFSVNNLNQGTYWVNLQNASVNTGDPVYWDENSGPSLASENSVGTIPSEAFTVVGNSCYVNCPPECVHDVPEDNFKIIHSFSGNEGIPASALATSQVGKLYGTSTGGDQGLGLAYQLAQHGEDWIFNPLYNFLGGAAGQGPGGEILGPERALYGTADGGLQQCGSSGDQYCGVVYRLRPAPIPCLTALCSWNESPIYQFRGDTDGWKANGNLVVDQAGNLYGTTLSGAPTGGVRSTS